MVDQETAFVCSGDSEMTQLQLLFLKPAISISDNQNTE